jgi:hypothetical protein
MPASTALYVGNIKGILGLSSNNVTGLVIDSITFDNVTTDHEFMDINSDVTSCAFTTHQVNISIDGRVLAGTAFTDRVAAALTLESVPNYLPAGYTTGGTTIIKSINHSEAIGEYQKLSMTAVFYPKVTTP